MTPEMLSHLGHYIVREWGYRYYVEKFDFHSTTDATAHVVCAGDGARFKLRVQGMAGCRYEDSLITLVSS